MSEYVKRYPSYRVSGVAWLDGLPAQWEMKRLRTLVDMRVSNVDKRDAEGEIPVRLCNYVDVYKNQRITKALQFMHATASTRERERFQLELGDVIITKDSEAWDDIAVPSLVEYTAPDLVCGYHLALLRPRDGVISGPYLFRAIQSRDVASQFHVAANGVTRFGLSQSAIQNVLLPVPPADDQAAIVRFLDYADRRIRRFIRAKQDLIKLLEEEKQAIIHRAITRGVDPNIRLKPSGVEWLGDVPEHWEIKKVKHVSRVLRGRFTYRPRNDPSLYGGSVPFLQTGDVARASRLITSFSQTLNERGLAVSKLFPRGTLAMTIAANIGDVAILDFDACFPDSVVGFVPAGIDRDFQFYVFRSMKGELLREAPVSTQGNLNVERIGSMRLPIPPLLEQKEIVSLIENGTQRLDAAISRVRAEMDLVGEYRIRLIADTVTGKLDVREAAATLPDESDVPEELQQADEIMAEGDDGSEVEAGEEVMA